MDKKSSKKVIDKKLKQSTNHLSIEKKRPSKQELEEITQKVMAQYSTAIKNLANR